jgi:pantetheine-phosphate adenylyltransferase
MKKIVFPGSFDPITNGHLNIIQRILPLFDEVIVGIGINSEKKYLFPIEKREAWIKGAFNSESKIKVVRYEGLTVDFCKKTNADYILRGVRSAADFEFERSIAQMNKAMSGVDTVVLISEPELSAVSSSIVRDIYRHGGDISAFVPFKI